MKKRDRRQTPNCASNRNTGLLVGSMVKIMTTDEIFDKKTGTMQLEIEDAWK